MKNNLNEAQKDDNIQRMFAAQAQIYTDAKRWMMLRFWLSLLFALSPFALLFWKDQIENKQMVEAITVPLAFCITILFPFLFSKLEQYKINNAAAIQQQIDLKLFGLPWSEKMDGPLPLIQDITEANARFRGNRSRFQPWYEGVAPDWSPEFAALYCQNQNVWWDAQQRKFFQRFFLWVGLVLLISSVVVGCANDYWLWDFLIDFLVPSLPLLGFCVEKFLEQYRISEKQLQKAAEIHMLMTKGDPISTEIIRDNQQAIFDIRKGTALVPDWIYKWKKSYLSGIVEKSKPAV